MKHHTFEEGLKYRPDYEWPEPGTERKWPKYEHSIELVEYRPSYYGKPWWCYKCKWQFSEEDFPGMECPKIEKK